MALRIPLFMVILSPPWAHAAFPRFPQTVKEYRVVRGRQGGKPLIPPKVKHRVDRWNSSPVFQRGRRNSASAMGFPSEELVAAHAEVAGTGGSRGGRSVSTSISGLFVPQRDDRVDASRAVGGDEARAESHTRQQRRHGGEGQGVRGAHAVDEA